MSRIGTTWSPSSLPKPAGILIDRGRTKILGGADATTEGVQASLLNSQPAVPGADPALAPAARQVLEALQVDAAIHLDDLLERMQDTSTSELIAALFELEMLGLVKQLPGKNFVKVW